MASGCRAPRHRCEIQERREDVAYRSQVNALMHACGQNMHGSIALGTTLALTAAGDLREKRPRMLATGRGSGANLRTVEDEHLLDASIEFVGFRVNPGFPAVMSGAQEGTVTKSADQSPSTPLSRLCTAPRFTMVSANHYRAAWSTKVVSREIPVDDGAVVSTIHDARPRISSADAWMVHSGRQLRAEGAAVQARPPGRRGRRPREPGTG